MLKKLLLLKHCIRVKGDLSVKVERYKMPKSSFLSVDKDMATLCNMFISNDRLCRLLYRTDKTPMQKLFEKREIDAPEAKPHHLYQACLTNRNFKCILLGH